MSDSLAKVGSRPPTAAGHIQGKHYEVSCHVQTKVSVGGQGLVVQPVGVSTLRMPVHGDVFAISHVSSVVHNVLMGKLWMEHVGELVVRNLTNGQEAKVQFKPAGWSGQGLNQVEGVITDKRCVFSSLVPHILEKLFSHFCLCVSENVPHTQVK